MADIEYLDMQDFIDEGYLHEINRLLLHPLGLALQLSVEGDHATAKVWNCRPEAEGVYFAEETLSEAKATGIAREMFRRRKARANALGYVIQPVETDEPTLTTTYVNPAERVRQPAPPPPPTPGGENVGRRGQL